jgi:hypothetical protein
MMSESINVYLTEPPNDQTVWMIQRIQSYFTDQNPMSQNALLTALREKYGKETLTNAVTANAPSTRPGTPPRV